MATIWIRRRHDPEHAEMKVVVGKDGHVSDVLEKASSMLVFEGGMGRAAGGLQAMVDGRVVSNKEPAINFENRSLVIGERGSTQSMHSAPHQLQIQQTPSEPSHSGPLGMAPQHTCARCHQPILGLKVVLTLPGRSSPVDLHPDCELEYERQNAISCNYCGDLILDRLTTLTGDFGTINLHPQCVDSYKKTPSQDFPPGRRAHLHPSSFQMVQGPGSTYNEYPPISTSTGFSCAHCKGVIEGTKVSLKLPGFQHKADLHPQCEFQYSNAHALKCDFCRQPMLDGITVLTGDFDHNKSTCQLHPSCVAGFKQGQTGHAPWAAPTPVQQAQYVPSATQWRPVEGTMPVHGAGSSVRWATTSG
eukprot:TRINITY_DN3105_c0_g2_i1.p1 TRINITY_DN3105_c0_g2~~TRINITY_DN3105_c0_g2_i1.p1  ORF type:complete len:360 (+),score=23.34 TRINITY_DN3105_c0_g2_i1:70-1149(+)